MITIKENVKAEIVEKKSRFIANVYFVNNKEEAESKIKEVKKKYYDARHNCSCYRVLEEGNVVEKANDDGEPAGTAGGPMLNILQKNDLCNIVVIVTRYFGGILLGTGGLVRAYSDVTKKAIDEAVKSEITFGKQIQIKIDYSNIEPLKYYCKKNSINIINMEFLNEIICDIEVANEKINSLLEDIKKRNLNILEYREVCDKIF